MSLANLPPLRESLDAHGLGANKGFGQHFLLDLNITRKIARLAEVSGASAVIEIGPGPGGLTRALLETGARVIAVEKDARFLPLLETIAAAADGRLTLIHADALEVDEAALIADHAGGLPTRIVANLPYNVGTPLLIKWLTGPFRPQAMALMFQKEVAERIVAGVGDEAYGRLAVISQALCEAAIVMALPARAFTPPSGAIGYIPPPPASAAADLEAAATAFLADRLFPEATARGLDPAAMVRPTVVHECSTYRSSTEAVAATILRTATDLRAANLVMVSHHKARLQEALWGSVSKTVAAQARMPVTLVH